jgi:hypothetical protein
MYVAHRFPNSALWWPTVGEDVRIEDFGTVPGKAFHLEVKVPEQVGNQHITTVDIVQLNRYLNRPVPVPVYYVFPEPPWQGEMIASGWLGPETCRSRIPQNATSLVW